MFMMLLTNPGNLDGRALAGAAFSSRGNFLAMMEVLCAFAAEDASKVEARQRTENREREKTQ